MDDLSILLVDDENFMRDAMKEMLIYGKICAPENITLACNGEEGILAYSKHSPQIIITDMMMPLKSGNELIREIRKINADVDIVVITGYADMEMATEVIALGVSSLLRKPFKQNEFLFCIRDVLGKKKLKEQNLSYQAQLFQMERLSSLGMIAAGIAHEINNPNTFIKNNLELLHKYTDVLLTHLNKQGSETPIEENKKVLLASQEMKNTISDMQDGTQRISRIVHSLLHSAKDSPGKNIFSLSQAIRSAQILLSYRLRRIKVQIEKEIEKDTIWANEQEVVQIIMNLLTNAADTIEEKWGEDNKGEIVIKINLLDEQVILTIADNGMGMSPETLKRMHDPFFTTKPQGKGTGLGMFIVRNLLQRNTNPKNTVQKEKLPSSTTADYTSQHGNPAQEDNKFEISTNIDQGSKFKIRFYAA